MSDTQAKATPSKAVKDLVQGLIDEGLLNSYEDKDTAEARIQSALADLVEKADECAMADRNDVVAMQHALKSALEPWTPEK